MPEVAWASEGWNENAVEASPGDVSAPWVSIFEVFDQLADERRLCRLTLKQVGSLHQIVGLFVLREHFKPLVNRDVQQVVECGLKHPQGDFGFKVRVYQVPQVVHVGPRALESTIQEADQKQFLGLVEARLEAESFVADQAL